MTNYHSATLSLIAAVWAALVVFVAGPTASASGVCTPFDHESNSYTVCTVDPDHHEVRLFWTDEDDRPYRSLAALPHSIGGGDLAFAMNAGMYDSGLAPVGLYVEDGVLHRSANTNAGSGNFHLLPNGVFYMDDGRPGVMETRRFLDTYPDGGAGVDLATQSGPMLVIDGEIHPRFIPDGTSRKRRNGVGVTDDGTIVFAITEGVVNFWDFGHLFRDGLGARNALYFDGTMSSLYAPHLGRDDRRRAMGPMVAAYEPR